MLVGIGVVGYFKLPKAEKAEAEKAESAYPAARSARPCQGSVAMQGTISERKECQALSWLKQCSTFLLTPTGPSSPDIIKFN
jgi:hypothetical protein